MIVLVEQARDRMIFDNVTHIEEKSKPSIFDDGTRKVVNLYSGETDADGRRRHRPDDNQASLFCPTPRKRA